MSQRKVILTPIAKNKLRLGSGKPDSRRDYEEQEQRAMDGEHWMWDDASFNQAKVGDVLGFVHNNFKVNYHVVTEVHPVTARLPSWAANIGQRNRQVLYLSNEVGRHSWGEWQEYGGYKKVQGTMYVKNKELKDCLLYLF
jgi:hypothetical protein